MVRDLAVTMLDPNGDPTVEPLAGRGTHVLEDLVVDVDLADNVGHLMSRPKQCRAGAFEPPHGTASSAVGGESARHVAALGNTPCGGRSLEIEE